MNLVLGSLVGIAAIATLLVVAWFVRGRRTPSNLEALGMQSALHAATSTLPHLRRGLHSRSASDAVPHLRALTGAAAIALADTRTVLAIDGEGREQVRPALGRARTTHRAGQAGRDADRLLPRRGASAP
jgi:two-component system LytT family sensor kinase